jgi:hypothetical protein
MIIFDEEQLAKVLNKLIITSNIRCRCFGLFWNRYFFIKFMAYSKSRAFIASTIIILEICPWSRNLFHIFLQPVRKLFLPSKTKSCSFHRSISKARIYAIRWLSTIFWLIFKPSIFWHTIN